MKKHYIKALASRIKGRLIAVASDEREDRHGDKLKVEDWDLSQYRKNPVLQFAHDYHSPPVGIAKRIRIEGKKLVFEPEFHELTQFAKEVGNMYKEGIMKAFSVGFMPGKNEKRELLEISCVPIGANRDALLVSKEFTPEQEKEVDKWIKKNIPISIKPYPNEHACRLRDPKDFKPNSFRRVSRTSKGKKYSVIMGRLKGETTMTEQAYRYKKDIWTAAQAKKHCSDHNGRFEAAAGKKKKKEQRPIMITIEPNIESIEQAVSTLKALLPKKKLPVGGESKPERSEPKEEHKLDFDPIIVRALQRIARSSNFALSKIKKKNR